MKTTKRSGLALRYQTYNDVWPKNCTHAELVKVQDESLAHEPAGDDGKRQDAQRHLWGG